MAYFLGRKAYLTKQAKTMKYLYRGKCLPTFTRLSVYILTVIMFLNSCHRYQYFTLQSSTMERQFDGSFIDETPEYKILFDFSGENCPLKIHITNKTIHPLYLDMGRSYAKIGQWPYLFWTIEDDWNYVNMQSRLGSIDSIVNTNPPGKILFIPPGSVNVIQPLYMQTELFKFDTVEKSERNSLMTTTGEEKAKYYNYNWLNTPLLFQCELLLSSKSDFSDTIRSYSEFWVDDIYQTVIEPGRLKYPRRYSYVSEVTEIGNFGYGLAGLTLLILIILITPYEEDY